MCIWVEKVGNFVRICYDFSRISGGSMVRDKKWS